MGRRLSFFGKSLGLVLSLSACSGGGDDASGVGGQPTGGGGASSGGTGGTAGAPLGGSSGSGGTVDAGLPDPVSFRETGPMHVARRNFTLSVLADGRALAIGGDDGNLEALDSVEGFDPTTETWTELAPLPEPRSNHTATVLADGRVLVAGGGKTSLIGNPSGEGVLTSALLYDPKSNTFTPTGSMKTARAAHRAARLADGRVLVVGGGINGVWDICAPQYPDCTIANTTATAEVYDPGSGQWSDAGSMTDMRMSFTLTALLDGSLLAVGGFSSDAGTSLKSAERFDPKSMKFESAGALTAADRLHHAAARLGTGQIVVAGGKKANVGPQTSVQIYDPKDSSWNAGPALAIPWTAAVMLELPSGHVTVLGGYNQLTQTMLDGASILESAGSDATWKTIGPLTIGRSLHAGAVLPSGHVLVCGGTTPIHSHTSSCDLGE